MPPEQHKLAGLRRIWSTPVAPTPALQREANLVFKVMRAQVTGLCSLALVIAIPGVAGEPPLGTIVLIASLLPVFIAMVGAHRGAIAAASHFAIATAVISTLGSTLLFGGLRSSIGMTLIFGPLIAAILRGRKAALFVGVLVGVLCIGLAVLEARGLAPLLAPLDPNSGVVPSLINTTFSIGILIALLVAYTREMEQANDEARRSGEREMASLSQVLEAERRQRQLEQELLDARRLEGLGRLAGGLAHDLRNMLTPILLNVGELKADAGLPPHLQGHLDEIQQASERSADLLGQLLAFARRQVLKAEVLDLNEQLKRLEPLLRRVVRENVRVEVKLATAPARVRVDRTQLDQVVVNLVANARDAMPHGGTLTLESRPVEVSPSDLARSDRAPGRYVVLVVADTGIGVSEEARPHIFEPFFSTKGKEGVGLGLATVHGVVTQSGGFIDVESQAGRGTTFLVHLPATDEAVPAAAAPAVVDPGSDGTESRRVVLVVDDQEAVRQTVARTLKRGGYTVLEASSAEDALALAAGPGVRVDLVVSDVVMPGLQGPALVKTLRGRHRGVRALLLTGYADEAIGEDGVDGEELLLKPFHAKDLLDRVAKLLSSPPRA